MAIFLETDYLFDNSLAINSAYLSTVQWRVIDIRWITVLPYQRSLNRRVKTHGKIFFAINKVFIFLPFKRVILNIFRILKMMLRYG